MSLFYIVLQVQQKVYLIHFETTLCYFNGEQAKHQYHNYCTIVNILVMSPQNTIKLKNHNKN